MAIEAVEAGSVQRENTAYEHFIRGRQALDLLRDRYATNDEKEAALKHFSDARAKAQIESDNQVFADASMYLARVQKELGFARGIWIGSISAAVVALRKLASEEELAGNHSKARSYITRANELPFNFEVSPAEFKRNQTAIINRGARLRVV